MKKINQIIVFAALSFAVGLQAQNKLIEPQDITVKHIVKPGENLHIITRSYLGTDILWQDNWKLNPQIENPNQLKIGQELTIIKERIIPAEKAKVYNLVNRVEKKPSEGDWLSAQDGDELVEQEGVRTYAKSSALLEFNDESKLKVLEFSQIFLQSRSTGLTGTDSATIEVVKGDAELSWEPLTADHTEITIVTGSAISKPRAEVGKTAEMRTGLTEAGNSVISVYKGNSAVASAGAEVNVKQGMGLAVKQGEAPPEPKPLLEAPEVNKDISGSYNYTNPWLAWSEVIDAVAYVVEICADKDCEQVLRQQKTKANQWQINEFERIGDYYFRVGGISADEIVGFRSKPQQLNFTIARDDIAPPVIAIDISGHRNHVGEQIVIGPKATIKIHAVDDLSGLSQLSYRWDDGEWQTYAGQALVLPVAAATLSIQAIDMLKLKSERTYQFKNQ